jgi:glycosyltransferase involved in cell wall biosynthesis
MAETIRDGETGLLVEADQPYPHYVDFGGAPSSMQSKQVYDPVRDVLKPAGFARPEALAQAVAAIVGDSAIHARMSAAAAIHARETFSFERYAAAFIESLRTFASNDRR